MNMGHDVGDKLTDYLATMGQLYMPFYSTLMKWDRYLHILSYLQFIDNRNNNNIYLTAIGFSPGGSRF